jgi:transcriptional regulator with XRE-family HTH domain
MPRAKTQTPNKAQEEKTKKEKDLIIRRLRTAMRLLGFTNREIERRLGYTPSYLTRLLSGEIELRFEHIVDIVGAMGMTAEEFFQFAYPVRAGERSEPAIQLEEVLAELRPGGHSEWTQEEIERTISKLFWENVDKFEKMLIPEPPTGGVHLIGPRDSASSSKRSSKSQSRKR